MQRTFKRIAGVSPYQYAAARRLERFKRDLKDGAPLTSALLDAGFQSARSAYGPAHRQLVMPPAQACARNPAALVIPCHRVVRADGGLGGYRWGVERKQKLLKKEASGAG